MRNDQIAVMLRDFARRALEWAAVLEKDDAPFPSRPVVEVPPTTTGHFFRCPGCNQNREWHLERPRWIGALCSTCYTEHVMRSEEAGR